jgi:hypothetical protein
MSQTSEKHQSLWLLAASPSIWAVHFLLSYVTVSVWCAKEVGPDGSLEPVRIAIAIYTALALIGIGCVGWVGHRRLTLGNAKLSQAEDTPEDRHRFLGVATFLLSILSGVAVLYSALVAVFFETCH